MKLSKTNFLIYRDCGKNAWLKIHKPDIYYKYPLSAFEEGIIKTGNEVDKLARELFPNGVLIEDREDSERTKEMIDDETKVLYQPVFETDEYKMISDILVWNDNTKKYDLYEVKASNSGEEGSKKKKDELYTHDIAFQYIVLKDLDIPIGTLNLVRLNYEYVRGAELDLNHLFTKEDFTESVKEIEDQVREEMRIAREYLFQENEPDGHCSCITKGRNSHCTTFKYSNPKVPDYSVHDISRIGLSKRKLEELVDSSIFDILDVPDHLEFSERQMNQILVAKTKKIITDCEILEDFFGEIKYPVSFLDYETFPSAIPRFAGYGPYNQIPFQFSLHILREANGEVEHKEFIYTDSGNPDIPFAKALQESIPSDGSVIVWNKSFEMNINKRLGERNKEFEKFMIGVNDMVVDLEDPFKHQAVVHHGFKGKTSIKYILPTLVPKLSYKVLDIQEGGTASNTWNEISTGKLDEKKAQEKTESLLRYCELDTLAMVEIFKYLLQTVKNMN
jgi:hypothetical protein